MAKSNTKSKRVHPETLETVLGRRSEVEKKGPPAMDWMERADRYLESLGFLSGDPVYMSADYVRKTLTISSGSFY